MSELTETPGIVALAAGALALIACVVAIANAVRLRRVVRAQRVVLGPTRREDLVAHAAGLQDAFAALHARVEEIAERLEDRVAQAERRLDGAIAYRALVRYDAYGELSGHQSATLALLDAHRNGVVLSSITHRDTSRLYCKQVRDGHGELQLAPEEIEAVRLALAGEVGTVTLET